MKKNKNFSSSDHNDIAEYVTTLRRRAIDLVTQNKLKDASAITSELMTFDDQQLHSANPTVTKDIIDIAGMLLPTKDYKRLEHLYLKSIQILENHKDSREVDVIIPLYNLMAFYDKQGNYQARDQIGTRIVTIAEQLVEPLNQKVAAVFSYLGDNYLKTGQLKAVEILYKQAHRSMMTQPDLPYVTKRDWLIRYANVLGSIGQPDHALEQYEQALSTLEHIPEQNDLLIMRLSSAMGMCALSIGDEVKAEQSLKEAQRIAEQLALEGNDMLEQVYLNLASLYLRQRRHEQYNEAEELIERGLAITTKAGKQTSSQYAIGLGLLALIAKRKEELDRAKQLYRESIRVFESAPDTEKGQFADFLTDAGFLYLARQQPLESVDMFRRAWELRKSTPSEPPASLAIALSNLAMAHFKADQLEEAIHLYTSAIDLRYKMLAVDRETGKR